MTERVLIFPVYVLAPATLANGVCIEETATFVGELIEEDGKERASVRRRFLGLGKGVA